MLAPDRTIVEGDDPTVGPMTVRFELLHAFAKADGLVAFARQHNISETYLSECVKGTTIFSDRLLKILGYDKVTRYRRRASL